MKGMSIHSIENAVFVAFGAIVGLVKLFVLNIHLPVDFSSKLLEGAITAAVCGSISWIAKEVCVVAKKAFIAYFKTRKPNKDERISE